MNNDRESLPGPLLGKAAQELGLNVVIRGGEPCDPVSLEPVAVDDAFWVKVEELKQIGLMTWLRAQRNQKLAACDWTQIADATVDKEAWATYRQALRDLPANTEDPENPVWPTEPSI